MIATEASRATATPKQLEVLEFIEARMRETGVPPTVREIAERFSINSPNGVICHLKALAKKGLVKRADGRSRSWSPAAAPGCCPTCGRAMEREGADGAAG